MKDLVNFLKSKNFHKVLLISKIYMFFKIIFFEPVICLLRYYLIYKPTYDVKKKLNFSNILENQFFFKSLKSCDTYLEFGSGNSTLMAKLLHKKFYSVESDKNFYFFMKKKFNLNNYFLRDLGFVKYYSIPLFFKMRKKILKKKALKYSNDILNVMSKKKIFPDLILIDGRYRVLTALCIHQYLRRNKKKSLIIIDDYKERKFYHILKNFFEIKMIGRFGILERIKNRDVTNLIDKYSLDYR